MSSTILSTKNAIRGAAVAVGYALGGPIVACAGLATGLAATRDGAIVGSSPRGPMVGCGCRAAAAGSTAEIEARERARRMSVAGDASPTARWAHG